ncbi:DUF4124 domain-containing protein [Massilia atriviolacea]|uniref:DUF4124 domain-containing protein n=1 Tax=Massilia atriviolacea TaxID=2495579 RepID=A0A430HG82_9BURK|nr:DUF4124 domain-containing protein [Massilia atriviolacea]RSZ56507.1 DUF4124 domain-containing protein [Massilia atriviolacea]
MRYRRPPAAFQRGAISLFWVAIGSVAVAGIAMAALFSMRYERNLFAEGTARLGKTVKASGAGKAIDAAGDAVGAASGKGDGRMRKCVIDGKTVISNTDCKADNRTSKLIEIHDTKGIEAPKKPVPEKAAPGSDPMLDKMIEKQLR